MNVTQQPTLHPITARCASCGSSFELRSTAETITTDLCSNCHPAYTGRERSIETGSRIARFNARRELASR
jgi:large subunit ribosomal protein L31